MLAPSASSSDSPRACAISSSRSVSSRRKQRAQEVGRGGLGETLRRPHPLDLRGDHRHQQPSHRRARLCFRAHVQRSDDRVGHAQGNADHALSLREQRALLRRRAGRHRERRSPGVRHREACLQRLARRAHHFRQARPGFDRLGDRVQCRQIGAWVLGHLLSPSNRWRRAPRPRRCRRTPRAHTATGCSPPRRSHKRE